MLKKEKKGASNDASKALADYMDDVSKKETAAVKKAEKMKKQIDAAGAELNAWYDEHEHATTEAYTLGESKQVSEAVKKQIQDAAIKKIKEIQQEADAEIRGERPNAASGYGDEIIKKVEQKKVEQKKPEEKKVEQKKHEEKKAEQKKPEEKKAEQKKPEE